MSTRVEHACRDEGGVRTLILEHHNDCNKSGCPGCLPCPQDHCTRCGIVHLTDSHPRTCPSCVGQVRNDILELIDKTLTAHTEHVHRTINSVVFMVAGPAANYEAHSYIHHSATAGRLCKCIQRGLDVCLSDIPDLQGPVCDKKTFCRHKTCFVIRHPQSCPDASFILEENHGDDQHPMTVLSGWMLTVARHYHHTPPPDITMGAAAQYLLTHLTALAQVPDDEFDFDDMAEELKDSHHWLGELLRLGYRPDTAGACPMCKKEKLVKAWDPRTNGTKYDPRNDDRVFLDSWVCPNPECGQVYAPDEYREKLDVMWVESADRLPSAELAQRLRVPASTVRDWAATRTEIIEHVKVVDGELIDAVKKVTPPRLRSCGRDAAGRKLYRVKDAEALLAARAAAS